MGNLFNLNPNYKEIVKLHDMLEDAEIEHNFYRRFDGYYIDSIDDMTDLYFCETCMDTKPDIDIIMVVEFERSDDDEVLFCTTHSKQTAKSAFKYIIDKINSRGVKHE